ncbi:MAG: proton-conducting transporter membrane subunit, partial [Pseudomonadota bacterium]
MIVTAMLCMVLIPLLGALVCAVLPKNLPRVVGLVAAVVVAALVLLILPNAFREPINRGLGNLPWLSGKVDTPIFGVFLDPLGYVLLLVVGVIGFLTVLFSTSYVSMKNREHATKAEEQGRYYFWLLLFIASMIGVALSPNFLQLFVFWEMTTVCSWALISFYQTEKGLRAGFKAMVMTHFGGLFFLFALLLLFVEAHSFEFSALAKLSNGTRAIVFVFLMIAAWAKAAQIPFHVWLPDAMEAPTPVSAYLHAAAMVKAGVYLMARSASAGWMMPDWLSFLMGAMALLTILVALSFYFVQDDLKSLL